MKKTLLVFLILCVSYVFAQKRAFVLDDLYKIKSVSDAQISPNGEKIAFTVKTYDMAKGTTNSEIFLINTDGSGQIQITNNPAADYHPRWHKDSKHILFLSNRINGYQAWVIRADGGEAGQLTDFYMEVADVEWLGDGEKIVFSSTVFPECGADNYCNERIDRALDKGPLKAHMADKLFYRHWKTWKDGKREHVLIYDPLKDETVDLTPGDYDSPALWGNFSVSADGKYIAVESNRDENVAETTNKDIYLIEVATLKTTNITDNNEAYDGQSAFSPDGHYIAYKRQEIATFEADRMRLMLYDRKTKTHKTLTADIDNNVSNAHWSADSRYIFFNVEEIADSPLYSVEVKTGVIRKVIDFDTMDDYSVSPDGKTCVFTHRSVQAPKEIYQTTLTGKTENKKYKQLTTFNKSIEDEVDLRPAEEVWIDSPTGKKIHAFLIKPHGFDPAKKYPAIINVHGGPQGRWADSFRGDWQMYPGSGYVLIFPNPHGSTGFGQEFTNAISKDWGGKVYQDVMAVTDYLAELPYVDAERLGAMGWSYGGYMMNWLAGHTDRFKAIVSMMGLYNLSSFYGATEELWFPQWDLGDAPWNSELYKKWSPDQFVENFKTPTLVITGEKDFRVPYNQSLEFFTALQKMGVKSRLIIFEEDGHWPNHVKSMPFYYNAHLDWFHTYLGGDPAPYDMIKMWRNLAY